VLLALNLKDTSIKSVIRSWSLKLGAWLFFTELNRILVAVCLIALCILSRMGIVWLSTAILHILAVSLFNLTG
jgi:hypothetical protein